MGSPCAQPGWAWRRWKSRNFNSWVKKRNFNSVLKLRQGTEVKLYSPLHCLGMLLWVISWESTCSFFHCKVRGKMGKPQHLKLVGALKHFCLAIFVFSQVYVNDRTSVRLGCCCTLILQVGSSSQKCEL